MASEQAQGAQRFAVYVINLDRSADRLAHMRDELARAGLSFERAPGVLGSELPVHLRPWFYDPAGNILSPLKLGEIGCDAAHLSVHLKMAAGEYEPIALILEDDVTINPALGGLVDAALKQMVEGWDTLRLSNAPKRAYAPLGDLGNGFELVRYSKVPNSAAAYLLSLSGARKLTRPGLRTKVIDEFLRRPWLAGLDTYGVVPPPVADGMFDSTIDAQTPRRYGKRARHAVAMLRRSAIASLPSMLVWNMRALGPLRWAGCAFINSADRIVRRISGRTIIHACARWIRRR